MYMPKSAVPLSQTNTGSRSGYMPKSAVPIKVEAQAPSVQGFGENIVKSGMNAVGDIGSAIGNVFNPNLEQNTLYNTAKLATGVMNKSPIGAVSRMVTDNLGARDFNRQSDETVNNVGKFYGNRYGVDKAVQGDFGGAVKQAGDTLYNDPVGVALDVSTLATGAGAVAGTGKVGKILRTVGKVTDPIQATSKFATKPLSKVFSKTGSYLENAGENIVTKGLGQPKSLKAVEKLGGKPVSELVDQYNLYDRSPVSAQGAISDVNALYTKVAKSSNKKVAIQEVLQQFDDAIRNKSQDAQISNAVATEVKDLTNRRQAFLDLVGSDPEIQVSQLTGIKSAVGKDIPSVKWTTDTQQAGNMASAKRTYNIYKDTINKAVPEAKQLGKDEAALIKLKELFENYDSRNKAKQNLNFTRLGTATAGGITAGIPGAIGGYLLEGIVNSPQAIKVFSKTLKKSGKAIKGGKINSTFGKGIKKGYTFSKYVSRNKEEK